jgi:hypothetical protein
MKQPEKLRRLLENVSSAQTGRNAKAMGRTRMETPFAHEFMLERLRKAGTELAIVIGPTDKDDPCLDWVGAVVSISGPSRGYPTLEQAVNDGLFHPGCRHALAAFDPQKASRERVADAHACTLHALRAMRARARGEEPPPLPLRTCIREQQEAADRTARERTTAFPVDGRTKFERVYKSAQKALWDGDRKTALLKCRAALDLLLDENLFGPRQQELRQAIEMLIVKLSDRQPNAC